MIYNRQPYIRDLDMIIASSGTRWKLKLYGKTRRSQPPGSCADNDGDTERDNITVSSRTLAPGVKLQQSSESINTVGNRKLTAKPECRNRLNLVLTTTEILNEAK